MQPLPGVRAAPSQASVHIWSRGLLSGSQDSCARGVVPVSWRPFNASHQHVIQPATRLLFGAVCVLPGRPCSPVCSPAAAHPRACMPRPCQCCAAALAEPAAGIEESHPLLLRLSRRLVERYLMAPAIGQRLREASRAWVACPACTLGRCGPAEHLCWLCRPLGCSSCHEQQSALACLAGAACLAVRCAALPPALPLQQSRWLRRGGLRAWSQWSCALADPPSAAPQVFYKFLGSFCQICQCLASGAPSACRRPPLAPLPCRGCPFPPLLQTR